MDHFLQNVAQNSPEGKAKNLFNMAQKDLTSPFIYVGDLVSDGEACLEARQMGANNVRFYGMTHEYAMNPPDLIRSFVERNKDFARTAEDLHKLSEIWNQR